MGASRGGQRREMMGWRGFGEGIDRAGGLTMGGSLKKILLCVAAAVLAVGVADAVARSNPITNPYVMPASSAPRAAEATPAVQLTPVRIASELNGVRMVAATGERLLLGDKASKLHLYSIAASGPPTAEGSCALMGEPVSAAISGDLAYVACSWGGLQIVDLADKAGIAATERRSDPDAGAVAPERETG